MGMERAVRGVGSQVPGLFVVACGWLALGSPSAVFPAHPPRVVTSLLPVYCFTHQIAGDRVRLDNLLAGGADAHDFQFSRRERQLLDAADLVVVNGLGMERWLQSALKNARPGLKVVEAAAGLGLTGVAGKSGSGPNPHVWLDPLQACHMVTNILRALEGLDPSRGSAYASNALACVRSLEALHEEFRVGLAPFRGAAIVTYHDAFTHLVQRYGLKLVGVIEEVPDVAPSPSHLSELARAIRQHQVKVIFTEPHHSGKLAYQLGRDLKVPVTPLDTLENGALRPQAYEEGMRRNLRTLQRHLK